MGVQINGDTGNISATKADYSGNVTIGGTLTYEDVTNIDSVGLVTARTGIEIGARPGVAASISVDGNAIFSGITTIGGNVKVGTGVTLSPDGDVFATGVCTATSFSGDGSSLTGIDADKISEGNTEAEVVDTGSDGHFKVTTEGSERMRISSEGYVTKPYNPVFMAYRTSNYATTTSASVLVFDNEKIDVGGNYDVSNGRFTAPVTGLYEFGYASIASNTQTVYRYDLRINGSIPYSGLRQELRIDQNGVTQYGTNGEFCLYINMTAGQYAEIYVSSDTNVTANGGAYGDTSYGYTYFRGRLIQ